MSSTVGPRTDGESMGQEWSPHQRPGPGAGFVQEPPRLDDEWCADAALRHLLARVLPPDVLGAVTPELAAMGRLATGELLELSRRMNRRHHEPRLVRFDAWGRRVDQVHTSPAWDRIGALATSHGLVATGYQDRFGPYDRVHQMALAYLFHPSGALYSCPSAMTDGAARTLLAHADEGLVERAVPRLTSRDPDVAWTSGQWMTERTGGSDVGTARTTAVRDGSRWRLHGLKWFTSAVTSEVALTLARPEGNPPGGRGLAVFYLEVPGESTLRILRLKDKLGTRQMPTAEVALEGTPARLVGEPAHGTRTIAPMLTVTRLWNAVTAAAGMRRALALARDYARRRTAFGRLLIEQPLHQAVLAGLRVEHEAALHLAFRAVASLGRVEAGQGQERLLRILTPLAKLVTAKQAVAVASEALESFGGAGYLEDTNLPVLLRDAQVLPIWEGTTNVLALDVMRAAVRDGAHTPLLRALTPRLQDAGRAAPEVADQLSRVLSWIGEDFGEIVELDRPLAELRVLDLASRTARAVEAVLLLEHARSTGEARDLDAARLYTEAFILGTRELREEVCLERFQEFLDGTVPQV